MFKLLPIRLRPMDVNLDQFLFESDLPEAELEEYGFQFEDVLDEIGSARVCLICADENRYFILHLRPEMPEVRLHVWGIITADIAEQIDQFTAATGFKAEEISYRIDQRYVG
ncbi:MULTISPECIES: hypothetical protein [unclassified Variovorax]|uniref:hypothetical protein n=1 Tax=unclassified Variovorax TaxID=663243 RepID=UPI003F44A13D